MIKIFADALEEHGAASVVPERIIAGLVKGVRVLAASTSLAAVGLVPMVALEATIALDSIVTSVPTVACVIQALFTV